MPTLAHLVDAYVAGTPNLDRASLGRLEYWVTALGSHDIVEISPEQVDDAFVALAERGRLQPKRGQGAAPVGAPLKGATLNRYLSTLGSVYLYARRNRLTPRGFVPPNRGVERARPNPVDPERYFRPDEVERLLKVARVLDTRWGKLSALVTLAFHTGLRLGSLNALKWSDIDLDAQTAFVLRTKNGAPHVAALTGRCVAALKALPGL